MASLRCAAFPLEGEGEEEREEEGEEERRERKERRERRKKRRSFTVLACSCYMFTTY